VRVSALTPVGRGRDGWLGEAAGSVLACRAAVRRSGVDLEWVVCLDGCAPRGDLPVQPDRVVTLAAARGVSGARTAALAVATGTWVVPLDADDLLDPEGFAVLVAALRRVDPATGWVGCNRLLVDGGATPYRVDGERHYPPGGLAEAWTSPFPFHPNSAAVRRELMLAVGGWPAMINEDVAAMLLLGEESAGALHPAVLTRYRVWDGQITAGPDYHPDKVVAFATIEAMVNARRRRAGRAPVTRPDVTRPIDLRAAPSPGRRPGQAAGVDPTSNPDRDR
jgi:hypothetical protein